MILPITIYGNPVLRKKTVEIDKNYKNLKQLIEDMWETMYNADGVGLAAPQINKSIRLIVIDASPFAEEEPDLENFKKVLINPKINHFGKEKCTFKEGCLSIPNIREDVIRPDEITITYQDENFETFTETWKGMRARIVQHECDHIEGTLFVDKISPIRRRLINGKLNAIVKNKTKTEYRILKN